MDRREGRHPASDRRRIGAVSLVLVMGLAALGCGPRPGANELAVRPADVEGALVRARAKADLLGQRLMAELGAQLESGTPAAAIDVCSRIAPAAAAALSGEGIEIRRTALRIRNPANAADEWERAWLLRLEEIVARGEQPGEVHEVDEATGELRYLRPIVVGAVCLQCHGTVEQLDPEVRRRVAEHYPEDRATGFSAGDLRGAFSVRVRLDPSGAG
jgi:hypothetical protein